ncbi:MAG TPA: hypothetical protein PKW55_03470 [Spirochaetota bacterium]|nr:hypothetical protein [Spirochaetota bacterium]HOM38105.1 hypothetical protein [Spirochaetota bacterium]HPQ48907.1 hypothetical protein [Spirochaetota bacterium]
MKKITLTCIILLISIYSCKNIKTMEQSIVSVIPFEKINITSEEINKISFYYNEGLYISNPIRGIFGISKNDIFLTIGEKAEEYNMPDKLSWESEFTQFLKNLTGEEVKDNLNNKKLEKRIFVNYKFNKIGKIILGNDKSIFIEHIKENGKEILKFSENGEFLYRIGLNGRDDQNLFTPETVIIKMYVNSENGLWIKYSLNSMLYLKYYNKYGKNLIVLDENSINNAINPYIPIKEGDFYQIEDIFPLMNSVNIGIIVNVYKKNEKYNIKDKIYIELNKNLSTENYWTFKEHEIVFFDINVNEQLVFLSYLPEENSNIVYVVDKDGKLIYEKKILLRKFNAKKVDLFLSAEGILTGIYRKDDNLVIIQWK